MEPKIPIVVIVGPTASGKTSLSIAIAKAFQGEVISADSRQVYRGFDLGSGKVTPAEMEGVPHHLLDIAEATTVYTAADFKHDATKAIADIHARGHLPIIAGGTFFYVDTLLGDMSIPAVPPNEDLRATLETKSTTELCTILNTLDAVRAASIDKDNPRRLIRAIEIATSLGHVPTLQETESPFRIFKIGIAIDKDILHHNIHIRLLERLEAGMLQEVENLLATGVSHERLESLGLEYRYLSRYLRGELTYEAMVVELETKIRQFAKRQLTWLKRDNDITWYKKEQFDTLITAVTEWLNE